MSLLERLREREGTPADKPSESNDNGVATAKAPRNSDATPPTPASPSVSGGTGSDSGVYRTTPDKPKRPAPSSAQTALRNQAKSSTQELKLRIHSELIERLDLSAIGEVGVQGLGDEIRSIIGELLESNGIPLSRADRNKLIAEITSEVLGFGPLDRLIRDDTVSDILVNTSQQVYVERSGKLEVEELAFRDDEHLLQIIDRIVSQVGRRVDASSPLVDARLPDGSRVNAVIPPIALDGPALSIRRFGKDPLMIGSLIEFRSVTEDMAELMDAMVKARLNIIVSGGTGSGKTTLLNCLSSFIPEDERVLTIEDAAEIQLQQPHVVRLETRPPNLEGKGEITARDLVKNALRMRPDRIVVGETRGAEALDMLQAMNTGHDGSVTTIHANSPRDCLSRLEMLILMAGVELPVMAMRQQISSAVDVVIQAARMKDGTRKVTKITEVVGMEGDVVTTQDLFEYVSTGLDEDGKLLGYHACCGIRPKCMDRLQVYGARFGTDFFTQRRL